MNTYGRLPLVLVRGEGCRVWDETAKNIWILSPGLRCATWATPTRRWLPPRLRS